MGATTGTWVAQGVGLAVLIIVFLGVVQITGFDLWKLGLFAVACFVVAWAIHRVRKGRGQAKGGAAE